MATKKTEVAKKIDPKIAEERFFAAISYVSVLCLISLLRKNSTFVQFHAKQGLLLFIGTALINIIGSFTPIIGPIFIAPIGNVIVVILAVLGIGQAVMGKSWKMPYLIGDLAEKF
jgi:uncharacterized membrane protein